ncbi:unnamed protein product, partial [Meganyctiphanes norvegica]
VKLSKMKQKKSLFKCDECYKECSSYKDLQWHKISHNKTVKTLFKCNICCRGYRSYKDLQWHKISHKRTENKSLFKCNLCYKEYRSYKDLQLHKISHNRIEDKTLFKCNECCKEYGSNKDLEMHKLAHCRTEDKTLFSCDECYNEYGSYKELQMHKFSHNRTENKNIFKCNECFKEYGSNKDLQLHNLSHTDDRMLKTLQMQNLSHNDDAMLSKSKPLGYTECLVFFAINSSDMKRLTEREIIMWIDISSPIYKQNTIIPNTVEITKRQQIIQDFLTYQKFDMNPSFIFDFMPHINSDEVLWTINPSKHVELEKNVKDIYSKFSVKVKEEISSNKFPSETSSANNNRVPLQRADYTTTPDHETYTSILNRGTW